MCHIIMDLHYLFLFVVILYLWEIFSYLTVFFLRCYRYYGEKVNRTPNVAHRKVIISTVYDDPATTDPHDALKRRNEPYHLKYRDEVKFAKSETVLYSNDDKTWQVINKCVESVKKQFYQKINTLV